MAHVMAFRPKNSFTLSLAQQNLNGDRQILCDHLHFFFKENANEWYEKLFRP